MTKTIKADNLYKVANFAAPLLDTFNDENGTDYDLDFTFRPAKTELPISDLLDSIPVFSINTFERINKMNLAQSVVTFYLDGSDHVYKDVDKDFQLLINKISYLFKLLAESKTNKFAELIAG